ncbi:MAG: hypothetical protein RLY31_2492 [Bacteroidota bacterium]|jgi:tetratricopeptide (TPR) repeat protein
MKRTTLSATLFLFLSVSVLLPEAGLAQAALKRAKKNFELSDYAKAIMDFQQVLEQDVNHPEANAGIGDAYRLLNQQEKALPYYQAAVLHPETPPEQVLRFALNLMELGQYEMAIPYLQKLVEGNSDYRAFAMQRLVGCQLAMTADSTPSPFQVQLEPLSTEGADFGPAFLGEKLVYASERTDIPDRNTRKSPVAAPAGNRLFLTEQDPNGFLKIPITLHEGLQQETNEGPLAYSSDGKWVSVSKNILAANARMIPETGMTLTLYVGEATPDGNWGNLTPFPFNGVEFSTGYPCFANDGKVLFFASDRPGGHGGFDLYVSYRNGSQWSVPENLGPAINTPGNEISPFFDGGNLYFSSDYHPGLGGFDIFWSADDNGRWQPARHAGKGLNSSRDDFGFIYHAARNIGYLVSNRQGGKGSEDIYRVRRQPVTLTLSVIDALSGEPIPGAIARSSGSPLPSQTADAAGQLVLNRSEWTEPQIVVRAAGYLDKEISVPLDGPARPIETTVQLFRRDATYAGSVLLSGSTDGIPEVLVTATCKSDGSATTTQTEADGQFRLLLPDGKYIIRFSKPGFRDLSMDFNTGNATEQGIPAAALLPVYAKPAPPPTTGRIGPSSDIPPPDPQSHPVGTPRFAIQLASGSRQHDLRPFQESLTGIGEVYLVEDKGLMKVRIGSFPAREQAEKLLASVREKGFRDAYIVKDHSPSPSGNAAYASSQTEPAQEGSARGISSGGTLSGFMIRLGVFKDTSKFDKHDFSDIGILSFLPHPNGDLTIALLTGYDSRSTAELALQKVKNRGYRDAFLVTLAPAGNLEKVR